MIPAVGSVRLSGFEAFGSLGFFKLFKNGFGFSPGVKRGAVILKEFWLSLVSNNGLGVSWKSIFSALCINTKNVCWILSRLLCARSFNTSNVFYFWGKRDFNFLEVVYGVRGDGKALKVILILMIIPIDTNPNDNSTSTWRTLLEQTSLYRPRVCLNSQQVQMEEQIREGATSCP